MLYDVKKKGLAERRALSISAANVSRTGLAGPALYTGLGHRSTSLSYTLAI